MSGVGIQNLFNINSTHFNFINQTNSNNNKKYQYTNKSPKIIKLIQNSGLRKKKNNFQIKNNKKNSSNIKLYFKMYFSITSWFKSTFISRLFFNRTSIISYLLYTKTQNIQKKSKRSYYYKKSKHNFISTSTFQMAPSKHWAPPRGSGLSDSPVTRVRALVAWGPRSTDRGAELNDQRSIE